MLQIEINTAADSSIKASGNGFEYMNDCANAITAMCNALTRRLCGDKEKAEKIMDFIYSTAMAAYRNGDQTVKLVKQTTVKTLGELLAEDTE